MRVHKGDEGFVGDVAKILHVTVFFDGFNDFAVAELLESGHDGGRDSGAQGLAVSPFMGVVERGEALDDGLPRENATQHDEIVCGLGQMGLNPLGTEGILKSVCYHCHDLLRG